MISSAKRFGPYVAALLVLAAMLLLVGSAVYNIDQQRSVDRKICESTVDNRDALRTVFETSRDIFKEDSENPALVDAIFERILAPIPPLACVGNQPVPKEG